jgi:predicted phage gp36 major capsid-like protein
VVDNQALSQNQAAPQTQAPRLEWIKASRSYALGECVELAVDGQVVALRDSKAPEIELRFTRAEMAAFLDGARRGEFDHLLG